MTSDLVMPRHLCRKAVVYIRQSTPHQVLSNQESLRLQYALRQRARDLGWNDADVEVIDIDLGQSGAVAEHRRGFKDLIARATLGEVGLILRWGGRPPTASVCQDAVVRTRSTGAARDEH